MAKIIPIPYHDEEEKSNYKISQEGFLKFIDAIYNGSGLYDEEEEKKSPFPEGYTPTVYELCHYKLDSMNIHENIQELKSYSDRIQECVDEFDKLAVGLNDVITQMCYNSYRKRIINIIIDFCIHFCELYEYDMYYDGKRLIVLGIPFPFADNFSLGFMYNTLVNIANFDDDYGPIH